MTYAQLIKHFGGASAAARALGIKSRSTVHSWKYRGIPWYWQERIEAKVSSKRRTGK